MPLPSEFAKDFQRPSYVLKTLVMMPDDRCWLQGKANLLQGRAASMWCVRLITICLDLPDKDKATWLDSATALLRYGTGGLGPDNNKDVPDLVAEWNTLLHQCAPHSEYARNPQTHLDRCRVEYNPATPT